MTERERLIEILSTTIYPRIGADPAEVVADFLLDNGVIVPQMNVGDSVYVPLNKDSIITANVNNITIYDRKLLSNPIIYTAYTEHYLGKLNFFEAEIGSTVFLTYEQAEAKLKEREQK